MRDRLGGRPMAELVELAQLVVTRGEEGTG
jgi:hypothetical protein